MKRKLALNTISSLFLQITTVICGFILPKIILEYFGSETNGLVNSILQFLQIIAFLELGVGAVVQSSLYKPLAEKDNESTSKIVVSANRFFKRLALILLGYTFVLMVFYPYLIDQSETHASTVFLIGAMSISSFAQYYFGVVNRLLLTADQKGYIQYITQSVTLILNTIASVLLIQLGASIQFVKLSTSLLYLLRPFALWLYVNKNYQINHNITYSEEPIKQKWNGVAQHIAAVVTERVDVLVLTTFRPLTDVSIYTVYQLVAHGVKQLFMSLTSGLQSLIGNLWAKGDLKRLREIYGWIEWIMHTGTILVFGIAFSLIMPFVSIYTKGVTDANYHQPLLAGILLLAHASHCLRLPNNIMILAGGHYRQTQKYYLIAAIINIVVSLVTVKQWGLNGVALGSLSAMVFHNIWMSIYNSRNFIKWPLRNLLKQLVIDIVSVFVGVFFGNLVQLSASNYLAWVVLAVKIAFLWLVAILSVNMVFYRERVMTLFRLVIKIIKRMSTKYTDN